jgi:uncharacterized membrane protein HdeD (DUF308 family)
MELPDQPPPDDLRALITVAVAGHWKRFLVQGLILELLGLLAFAMPFWGTLAVAILLGWLLLFGGIVRVIPLVWAKHLPGYWWSLGAAMLAIVAGLLLLVRPLQGMMSLTLLLMLLFLIEGVAAIVSALDFRHHTKRWGWLLVRGLIDLVLVAIIWSGWPGSAGWAIGVLVGVNLFLMGLTMVVMALGVRSAARPG